MSEEDNWKIYKVELHETMSKGTCVPFLGQFLTQIMQQETVKEVISYRRKAHGRRPQSGDLSADDRETLSAPTTPVNSDHDDMLDVSEAVSPTDLNLNFDEQKTPTLSNMQPDMSNEGTTNEDVKEDEVKHEAAQEEECIKKQPSSTSVVERRDKLSPLPIGKFKKNYLTPTNLYKESFKRSSLDPALQSPTKNGTGQQDGSNKIIENGDIASNKLTEAKCEVVKALSLESLDSYDGASSCYSRGSTPARDVPNVPDSEAEDTYYNNAVLDVAQVELNIDDSVDTPTSDFDKEGSPDTNPVASTPIEEVTTDINTMTEGNETPVIQVKKSKDGKKKRRWNSFRRKSPPPEAPSHSATNCTEDAPHKRETATLRRKLSSPLRSISSPSCNDNNTLKKEKRTSRRKQSSPARESSPSCHDDTPRKKEKRGLQRKMSSPLRGHSNPECNDNDPPQRREKLHIYEHPDVDCFNAHTMLQQMQFSSMRYMTSLDPRPDVQSFIKGLQYNSEEDNYHISIQMEPIEQHNY